jgi:LPS-assembly protein
MKTPFRIGRHGARRILQPTPLTLALLCVFPACAQAAVGLPPLKIDPSLVNPPPGGIRPYGVPESAETAPAPVAEETPKPAPKPAAEVKPLPKAKPVPAQPIAEPSPSAASQPAADTGSRAAPPVAARKEEATPEAETPAQETRPAPAILPARKPEGTEAAPQKRSAAAPAKPIAPALQTPAEPPVYITANRQQGHEDSEVEAFGQAELVKGDQKVRADYLTYFQPEDEVYAKDNVVLEQKSDTAEGPELRLQLNKKEGYMTSPTFRFGDTDGRGEAESVEFRGQDKYLFDQATYTTCPVGNDDWYLRVKELDVDRTVNTGIARQATVMFRDVPILYTPRMSFALKKERKSGFLSPIFATNGNNGAQLTTPYYWNIAPNRDATITPHLMTKRGLQVGAEFRYLEPTYQGQISYETLPNDRIAGINRNLLNLQHGQSFGGGWGGMLNIQKVSDPAYFTDLSTTITQTSQALLPRQGMLTYGGGWWSFIGQAQKWQSLTAPDNPPYARLPQLLATGTRQLYRAQETPIAANFNFVTEYVDFSHPTLINAKRAMLYPSISFPITPIYGFLTPKIGVHTTRYMYDKSTTTLADTSRTVPIFSLDSGLYFERDLDLFGRSFQQTLEPRAYYVYVPYRDQNAIPVFDTGDAGFGVAQIFTENRFGGNDRISDANQVTLGVTSRFLEATGIERLRATVAQRYYFKTPQVVLPGQLPPDRKISDLLATVGGQLTREWRLDSFWQYNPDLSRTEIFNVGARYKPEDGKLLNMSFRYTPTPTATVFGVNPGGFRQLDVSGQWPLYGRWHGVGRMNYSILDKAILEGLAGVEYDGGCWAARAVVHSLTTGVDTSGKPIKSNTIFFQLELNGLSSIGSNPLEVLNRNIYGYTKFNQSPTQ